MDRQIYRLIGKATTLAAYAPLVFLTLRISSSDQLAYSMAYRVRQGREFVTPPVGLSYTGSSVVCLPVERRRADCRRVQVPVPNGPPGRGKLQAEPNTGEGA